MRRLIQQYNLKTGLLLAIVFPGIFMFDNTASDPAFLIAQFLTFFLFISSLWLFNFRYVDFSILLRRRNPDEKRLFYRNISLSFLFSAVIYFVLGFVFRQQDVLLASVIQDNYSLRSWFFIILKIVLFNAGILIIKYITDSNREKQRVQLAYERLKTEQVNALHQTLKQQVDPHFLFNSLNTLQSLVKQNKEQSVHFIQQLSAVYRYMLATGERNTVTLREEIQFLQSYLYLLQIRFGAALQTRFQITGEAYSSLMPVHTLQLLAENAVKHNSVSQQHPLTITITTEGGRLVVSNNLQPKQQSRASSGIGLQNIQNRYKLLFEKEISITAADGFFIVSLPLIAKNENPDHRRRGADSLGFEANHSSTLSST